MHIGTGLHPEYPVSNTQYLLFLLVRMPVGALAALEEPDGVGQSGQDRFQVLADGLGTAGQVDDERRVPDTGHCPREHGVGGDGQAGGPHRFDQAGTLAQQIRHIENLHENVQKAAEEISQAAVIAANMDWANTAHELELAVQSMNISI